MTIRSSATHWLADAAARAGLESAAPLSLAGGTPPVEAWAAVAMACRTSQDDLARRVASVLGMGTADLDAAEPRALKLVPEKVARRLTVFPLREDDRRIAVATGDPFDLEAEQAIRFAAGRTPVFEVAPPAAILTAIDARYSPERSIQSLLGSVEAEIADAVRVIEDLEPEAVSAHEAEAAPVVKFTNLILQHALNEGASDIHVEPGRGQGVVRFRVDGLLRQYLTLPMPTLNRVISRIKVMTSLDIADRLRPQDGRTRIQAGGRYFDLRVSTVPTRDAEKAVVRILDPQGAKKLQGIGLPTPEAERFRQLLTHREGIVVVTGPTGSGKTTTLYAALKEVATGKVNIMTVEDPVEYELPGMTQMQVEPKRGVTFASALRAILRQDPDIIFVGEVRDLETAEMAVQASMTGHLVLTTLHANDAAGVVWRLTDLGLRRASVAATLRGILSQRLVRRVCPECSERAERPLQTEEARLAERYGVEPVARAAGCPQCGRTGYKGRLPVCEVLVCGSQFAEAVSRGVPAPELQRAAVAAGMRPIFDVARERVRSGETTLQEVERMLGEIQEEPSRAAEPRVLVVDDDPVNRRLAAQILEKGGFRVSEAGDGVAAVERLESEKDWSLVVLDPDMPKMGGRDVLGRVRKSPATAALPVVVFTSAESPDLEVLLMEEGADDYIRKPIDPPRFLARVKGALRRAGV